MIKLIGLLVLFGLTLVQCGVTEPGQAEECPGAEVYTLSNLTGLDGCAWVLVQGDQSYEPINLGEFVTDAVEGQEVWFEIEERPDFASICLVGTIVEITCFRQ